MSSFLAGVDERDNIILASCSTKISTWDNSQSANMNILLDAGAKCTLIEKSAAQRLGLKPLRTTILQAARFNTASMDSVQADVVQLIIHGKQGFQLKTHAYAVPNLTPPLPIHPVSFIEK